MHKYLVIFEKTPTGFSCYVPDLPGCIATGRTREEAEKNIFDGIAFHIEGLEMEGVEIPQNQSEAEVMVFAK